MPRVRPHHHPCADCQQKTECPGTWLENYDGFPEVVCDERDVKGYETVCDACQVLRETNDELEGVA